ncbi:MAG: type II secretion system F family protein [Microthrixaceae bacterium]
MSPAVVLSFAWLAWAAWSVGALKGQASRALPPAARHPWVVVGGVLVALAIHPVLALVVGAWWLRGALARRRRAAAVVAARWAAVPEVADLFVVALSAGLTVRTAVVGVAEMAPGVLGADLTAARRRLAQGATLVDALRPWRTEEHPLDPVAAALGAADRSGAAAGPVLARCADHQRELARRRAEEQVRRLPVRLLGPLVLCILPALMVATFGPLAVVSLRQLGGAVP